VPISRKVRLLLWTAVLLLALALRLPAVTAGLPYLGYVDEGHVLHHVVRMLRNGTWEAGWYLYPSLPLTAIAMAARLGAPVYHAVHGHPLTDDLSAFPPVLYDLAEPVELIVLARGLTLLASLGIVLLTGLLARRLAGPEGADATGLLAALCAALLPALVIRGAAITVDPWATLFVVAALYCAEGAVRRAPSPPAPLPSPTQAPAGRGETRSKSFLAFLPSPGDRVGGAGRGAGGEGAFWYRGALLAGTMTGLAFASKYPAVLVGVAVGATLLRVAGGWRERVRCLEIAALSALAAAAIAMPALVTDRQTVLTDVARQSVFYAGQHMGSYWDQAVRRAEWDQPLEHPEIGIAFLLWAGVGFVAAVADRRTRPTAIAWALYAGAAGLALASYPFRPFRNVLPLIPLACVLAALIVARVREKLPRRRMWVDVAAAVLAVLLLLPASWSYARGRAGLVDSRVQAMDWVREHAAGGDPQGGDPQGGDPILISQELAVVRSQVARLGDKGVVLPEQEARKQLRRHGGFAVLMTSPVTGLPDLVAAGGTREPYELAARFGETPGIGQWRGNRQVIFVYRRLAAAPR